MNHTVTKGIHPIKLDNSVTFSSVGGLDDHIKCLREIVLFPLMYPNFFKRFNTRPPKGVLFHGPPGTGKTLLARALANECRLLRGRKVAFFMRKGADVMDKFYGESEKLLNTLFQKASKMRPSIIFFDEIDALAPIRKDVNCEAYTSIVATLLAELDGLCDRGDVIVIGATNRPDAIDPALRRPGRLDRELYFPPPNIIARRQILDIYTNKWEPKPSDATINYMARITSGYLGSDLNALCTEAVLKALKRVYPQVYHSDYRISATIDIRNVVVTRNDLLAAKRIISPAGGRCTPLAARSLPHHCEPLLKNQIESAAQVLRIAFPRANAECTISGTVSPSVFLICGECSETFIAPALLTQLEHCAIKEISMATIHSITAGSQEQAIITAFAECRREERDSVIFIRDILAVWESLGKSQAASLLAQLWRTRAAGDRTLLFASSNVQYHELPEEVQVLFPRYKDCLYNVREPHLSEVINFIKPIINIFYFPKMDLNAEESESIIPPIEEGIAVDEQESSGSSGGETSCSGSNTDNSSTDNSTNNDNAKDTAAQALIKSVATRKRRLIEGVPIPTKRSRMLESGMKKSNLSISEISSHNSFTTDSESKPISEEDIEKIFSDNAEALRKVGLEALIDLYEQMKRVVPFKPNINARIREFGLIVSRYVKMVNSSS